MNAQGGGLFRPDSRKVNKIGAIRKAKATDGVSSRVFFFGVMPAKSGHPGAGAQAGGYWTPVCFALVYGLIRMWRLRPLFA